MTSQMEKTNPSRPTPFVVTSYDEEPALGEGGTSRQQSELQPGEIRRPGVHPPTPLMDWGRGDSLMWDSHFGGGGDNPSGEQQQPTSGSSNLFGSSSPGNAPIQSPNTRQQGQGQGPIEAESNATSGDPLTGYGRGDNIWGTSPTGDDAKAFPSVANQQLAAAIGSQRGNSVTFAEGTHGGGGAPGTGQGQGPLDRESSSLVFQYRTQSQILSEELFFQSQWFPPPPPPRVPKEARRSRSELWFYYASKWDITHTQPPPPRCPLSLMEEEYVEGLPQFTKVPYRGEYWLDRCWLWFQHVQNNFHPPEVQSPHFVDPNFVIHRCITE